jgi:hypothetical protein
MDIHTNRVGLTPYKPIRVISGLSTCETMAARIPGPRKLDLYGCRAQHVKNLMWGRGPSLGVWAPSGLL